MSSRMSVLELGEGDRIPAFCFAPGEMDARATIVLLTEAEGDGVRQGAKVSCGLEIGLLANSRENMIERMSRPRGGKKKAEEQ